MLCEKCGNEMSWFKNGCEQGWKCSVCEWGVVTTYFEEIYRDMTVYSIYLIQGHTVSKEQIKMISKIGKVNYIVARKMLSENKVLLCKGNAVITKDNLNKLKKVKLQFQVEPAFPYNL